MRLRSGAGRNNIGPVLAGLVSALFYQLGFVLFLFLVPLQVAYERRGVQTFVYACLTAWAAIAAVRFFELRRIESVAGIGPIAAVDLVVPAVFFVGLWIMNSRDPRFPAAIYRLLAAGVLSVVVFVPTSLVLLNNEAARALLQDQFRLVYQGVVGAGGASELVSFEEFLHLSGNFLASSFVFMYLMVLGANWVLGRVIGNAGERALLARAFVHLQVPVEFTWPALMAWAAMLVSVIQGIGIVRFVAWNLGLTALMLYGIQGIAILRHGFDRRKLGRGARTLIVGALVLSLMIPGLNILVFVGVPLIGISELWINYHRFEGVEQP